MMLKKDYIISVVGWIYRHIVKPVLFVFPPERIHQLFGWLGRQISTVPFFVMQFRASLANDGGVLGQHLQGIYFDNPVGIAAGFDKDANLINLYSALGCGYSEIGSITLHPYEGNPSPRLIRLPKDQAIFVNYGLKNHGVDRILQRLLTRKDMNYRLFVSVARTNCKETADSLPCALDDYEQSIRRLLTIPAYREGLTLNISCPNARSGEQFATPENLAPLLEHLSTIDLMGKPVFLKMPLLDNYEQAEILATIAAQFSFVKGLVISNLLKDKQHLQTKGVVFPVRGGGISGKPTQQYSDELLRRFYLAFGQRFTLVGVGGIFSAEDAYRKICLGASLVQVATGLVYRGPQLIAQINQGLLELLHRDGFTHISTAIGSKA